MQPVCLETSFTSLQSPAGEPYPLISSSSKASSMAGSLFSRSQLNSILHYDGTGSIHTHDERLMGRSTSAGPSEAPTVILADQPYRTKSVAFDISRGTPSVPSITSSPSPNFLLKSILHRQANGAHDAVKKRATIAPSSLSPHTPRHHYPPQPPTPPIDRQPRMVPRHIDFTKDDWVGMGLAPLASPETLSEISSISSRTSMGLATSIENYLHRLSSPPANRTPPIALTNEYDLDLMESQLHTPKVMRRAPKITGNLSTCADDWQSVDKYKRMGKVFFTNPVPLLSSDSSGDSFESTHSLTKPSRCFATTNNANKIVATTATTENSKSADNLDNEYESMDASLGANKLTMSDSAILDGGCNSKCPRCPCKRSTPALKISCCRRKDHSWCSEMPDEPQNNNNTSSSDTYYSAFSSDTLYQSPPVNVQRLVGVLESHFPVYAENSADNESESLLPCSVSSPKIVKMGDKQTMMMKNGKNDGGGFKRYASESERRISRNDSLPLLANLVDRSSPNSFNRRRNHTVYPITSSPRFSPSKCTESNV